MDTYQSNTARTTIIRYENYFKRLRHETNGPGLIPSSLPLNLKFSGRLARRPGG
jgi:hypothetical protein